MADSQGYDFLQEVFEWVFYNMPIYQNNAYMRKLYGNYKKWGGLSKWQMKALLDQVNAIPVTPTFNPATLEAMIKKKGSTYRSFIPDPSTSPATQEAPSKEIIEQILSIAPAHKAALFYKAKLESKETLKPSELEDSKKILRLLLEMKARQNK